MAKKPKTKMKKATTKTLPPADSPRDPKQKPGTLRQTQPPPKGTVKLVVTPDALKPGVATPLSEAFRRWKDENAQISVLASELNIKRSKLRRTLIAMAGGKEQFRALRSTGAGGTAEPFGGKRAVGRTRETIANDDSSVQRIKAVGIVRLSDPKIVESAKKNIESITESLKTAKGVAVMVLTTGLENAKATVARAKQAEKHTGWKSETIFTPHGSSYRILSPDGLRYVKALSTERADLLMTFDSIGAEPLRLRLEKTASLTKRSRKEEQTIERGEAILNKKTERSKQRKQLRKKRS